MIVLKIKNEDKSLEVGCENGMISFWIGAEFDIQSWSNIDINKEDAHGLVEYLQKVLEQIDPK